ncbi:MAG: propionyl-CoA synthetase [Pseudomonadota bacterium]|nr:propionyl-CoA synthetase [Pseudomonadota bacterium]
MDYRALHRRSIDDPSGFWGEQSQQIAWMRAPTQVLAQDENGADRWFVDGLLNTCDLAVDQHVRAGRGECTAVLYDSPVTGTQARISYATLQQRVASIAGGLRALGVERGDRVVIYMPMVPEALMAMLACARLGAVHVVVFGGFAAPELAIRIDSVAPKVLLTASCGIEPKGVVPYQPMVDEALRRAAHPPSQCVVLQRPQALFELQADRDLDWHDFESAASPVEPVPVAATDPLYILHTSGTTGRPKGVVRDNGGHAVALTYSMGAIYAMNPGDVYWAASDIGWVVGHSYIVYGPLLAGCTTVLYEGKPVGTPDASAFWRVISEHRVQAFFTAPTAFRAIKKADPEARAMRPHDLSSLRHLFLAGERLDPPTYEWLRTHLDVPVLDHWWQTETGWAIAANPAGLALQPSKPGSATFPAPGFNVQVLDSQGAPLPTGETGNITIRRPLPPGCLPTLWNDHPRCQAAYFERYPGHYLTGDGGHFDADGYLFVMGRTDDVINVAGHRLSTGEMEEVVARHPAVAECAVVGVQDDLKGQLPLGLVVLKDGADIDPAQLQSELVQQVREAIGPIACFRTALVVERLPKTRSGKVLRNVLRKIADGEPHPPPPTIDDPAILEEIETVLENRLLREKG